MTETELFQLSESDKALLKDLIEWEARPLPDRIAGGPPRKYGPRYDSESYQPTLKV